jgi:hypothetical protein
MRYTVNASRFFWDSHWLEIWKNHLCPSMGLNGGSVAVDSVLFSDEKEKEALQKLALLW